MRDIKIPPPPGTAYDLTDQASLDSDPNVEVIAYSPSLKAIRWLSPRYGQWNLHTDSSSTYSISVSANSTLSFMGDFSILDPRPPHPHYELVEGRPLISESTSFVGRSAAAL